jgi:hypothetical protein
LCLNNVCQFPSTETTALGYNIFISLAQNNGNVTAPQAYACPSNICSEQQCSSSVSCPISCPYCINDVCRCTKGVLFENCASNNDCESGVCEETEMGSICIQKGGLCAFNYKPEGCSGCCPSASLPYCSEGICSSSSLGSVCGATGMPYDLCNNPQSIGSNIVKELPYFCVNGICSDRLGKLNDFCTANSCEFINGEAFSCNSETNRCD